MRTGAGRRDQLVTFEAPSVTPDQHGGQTVNRWVPIATAWCQVRPLSAYERLRAMRLQLPVTHEVTVPWSIEYAHLSFKHRVNLNGRTFNIVSVFDPEEAHIELKMLAEEGVPT